MLVKQLTIFMVPLLLEVCSKLLAACSKPRQPCWPRGCLPYRLHDTGFCVGAANQNSWLVVDHLYIVTAGFQSGSQFRLAADAVRFIQHDTMLSHVRPLAVADALLTPGSCSAVLSTNTTPTAL